MMLSVEEQIERIADAGFDDTNPVKWSVPPPLVEGGSPSRRWLLAGAAALVAVLVVGLLAVVRDSTGDPVTPIDTAPAITTHTPTTEVSTTSTSPAVSTTMPAPDLTNQLVLSPFSQVLEEELGAPFDEISSAIHREEVRAVADCVNDEGWFVTGLDLAWLRTETRPPEQLDSGDTYAENALYIDELRAATTTGTLRDDEAFSETLTECTTNGVPVLPGLKEQLAAIGPAPSFGVGSDPRYVEAEERYRACVDEQGYTVDSLTAAYDDISTQVFDVSPKLEGSDTERTEAQDTLERLDDEETALDDRVASCTDPLLAVERNLVFEREADYLEANPDYADTLVPPGLADTVAQVLADDQSTIELSATDTSNNQTITLLLPPVLADFAFDSFGSDPTAPDRAVDTEPAFILRQNLDDPMHSPRLVLSVPPEPDASTLDSDPNDVVKTRTGESEPRLIDTNKNGVRLVLYESTLPDQTGRTVQAATGTATTPTGTVVSFDARGIGLQTVLEVISNITVTE